MSRDYAALERELIEELQARTGRTLGEWMAAIDAATPGSRNAIIDWLRPQGFSFSRASWLERIHHNGGRPVYGERATDPSEVGVRPRPSAAPVVIVAPEPAKPRPLPSEPAAVRQLPPTPTPTPVAPTVTPVEPPSPSTSEPAPRSPSPSAALPGSAPSPNDVEVALAAVLPKAKAYRPLAEMILRDIRRVLPDMRLAIAHDIIVVTTPSGAPTAALVLSPRELRLALDLTPEPIKSPWGPAKLPASLARLTHMRSLTDARQVDTELTRQLAQAWSNAQSR